MKPYARAALLFVLPCLPLAAEEQSAFAELDEPGAEIPVVLSASRLKQPQSEAPASVTVLDRELLEASGVRRLVDALRLVPGMQVGYEEGHQQTVSYHGMADENSRRMQVLVDGRSIYQPFLARILWNDLPLALEDVERIEVIRGPNSALYGANSFLAVVNIITRHPADRVGTRLSATQGGRGVQDDLLSHAAAGERLDWRLSLGAQADNGFDHRADGSTHHDDSEAYFANLNLSYALSDADRLHLAAGHKTGTHQISGYDAAELSPYHDKDVDNGFLQLRWQHEVGASHEWYIQASASRSDTGEDWRTCQPGLFFSDELATLYDADAAYTDRLLAALSRGRRPPEPPAALAALAAATLARAQVLGAVQACGEVNQDLVESRVDLEFQDSLSLGQGLRLVSGANLRREAADSETYLGGRVGNDIARLFGNLEWRFAEDWLANAGATWERDELVGTSLSPRLGLNWHWSEAHSFRAVIARATRTPDLFEAEVDWRYRARDLQPPVNPGRTDGRFFVRTTAFGDLSEERILSRELGYFYRRPESGVEIDLKLFDDRLSDLLEGNNNFGDFLIRNDGRARLRGGELQVSWRPGEAWRAWLTYAYLDMDELSLARNRVTAPVHQAGALLHYRFAEGWSLSGHYYWLDEFLRARHEGLDLRLAHELDLGGGKALSLEAVATGRLDREYFYDRDNNYDRDWTGFLRLALHF
ncbi:MAG: TonB-dependent receptor [Gammaproteobacteria bacterium]|nr:TonB-dependent receptor [Gammaproteobacteria bacterium]